MLTVEEALAGLLRGIGPVGVERVAVADALGRAPARAAIVADHDVPPFANSAMDGFALVAADGLEPRTLIGESRAGGGLPPAVRPGTAVRIMTGAPLPDGADAVVPIEEASEADGMLDVHAAPTPGAHVRAAGHDVAAGTDVPMPPLVTPSVIALLAALGVGDLEVRRRPRVAVLSTGDELAEPGTPLRWGQIHDANGPALAAAVTEAGGEAVLLPRAGDDPSTLERILSDASRSADLLVASGGVSVGDHDHVRAVIERLGALEFWRIAVQPGKPLAFGRVRGCPVVALPGNPVSALVTFELFVRPMIRAMLGLRGDGRLRIRARVDESIAKDPSRRALLRVRVCRDDTAIGGYRAVSAGGQASSQLLPLAGADALLVVPEGLASTHRGESYEAIVLGALP